MLIYFEAKYHDIVLSWDAAIYYFTRALIVKAVYVYPLLHHPWLQFCNSKESKGSKVLQILNRTQL